MRLGKSSCLTYWDKFPVIETTNTKVPIIENEHLKCKCTLWITNICLWIAPEKCPTNRKNVRINRKNVPIEQSEKLAVTQYKKGFQANPRARARRNKRNIYKKPRAREKKAAKNRQAKRDEKTLHTAPTAAREGKEKQNHFVSAAYVPCAIFCAALFTLSFY